MRSMFMVSVLLAAFAIPARALGRPKAVEGTKAAAPAARPLTGYGRITWQTTQDQLEEDYEAKDARDAAPATTPPGATVLTLPKYPSPQYRDADVIERAPGIIVKLYQSLPYQIVVPYSFVLQRDDMSGGLVVAQAEKDLGKATRRYKDQDAPEEVVRALHIPYERGDAQLVAEWRDKGVSAYLVFAGFRQGEAKFRQLVIINETRWKEIASTAVEEKPEKPSPEAVTPEDKPKRPATVIGWRDFKFGDSIEAVKRRFPNMSVPEKSPFKDPKPLDTVKTFAVAGTSPDVTGVFLRFYKDRLYYVAVGFSAAELRGRDYDYMLSKLRPELGEPSSVKQVAKAGHRRLTMIATWTSPEFGAQLIFAPQYFTDVGEAVLHVVSEAIDKQVQAELGGN